MLRRLSIILIALGFLAAAIAIAAVSAGGSTAPSVGWTGKRQSLSNRVNASPVDTNLSVDAQHVFGSSSAAEADAHIPLTTSDGAQIEAGIKTDGSVCFDVTTPGRAPAGTCGPSVDANNISGVINQFVNQPTVYAGLAGDNVTAVDVLTDQGTVSAMVENGAFYSSIPNGSSIKGWVITLADGSTTTHNWPPDSNG